MLQKIASLQSCSALQDHNESPHARHKGSASANPQRLEEHSLGGEERAKQLMPCIESRANGHSLQNLSEVPGRGEGWDDSRRAATTNSERSFCTASSTHSCVKPSKVCGPCLQLESFECKTQNLTASLVSDPLRVNFSENQFL